MSSISSESDMHDISSDSCDLDSTPTIKSAPSRKRLFDDLEMSPSPQGPAKKQETSLVVSPIKKAEAPTSLKKPEDVLASNLATSTPNKDVNIPDATVSIQQPSSSSAHPAKESSFDLHSFSVKNCLSDSDENKVSNIMVSLGLQSKHTNLFALLPILTLLKCKNDLHFFISPFRSIKSKLTPRFFSDFHFCNRCDTPTKLEVYFFVPSIISPNPHFTRSLKNLTNLFGKIQVNSIVKLLELSCEMQCAIATLIAIKFTNARVYLWKDSVIKTSRGTVLDLVKKVYLEGEALPNVSSVAFFMRESQLVSKKAEYIKQSFEKVEFLDTVMAYEKAGVDTITQIEKDAANFIKITGNHDRKVAEGNLMKKVDKAVNELAQKTIKNPKTSPNVQERLFDSAARDLRNTDMSIDKVEKKYLALIKQAEEKKAKLRLLYRKRNGILDQLRREPNKLIFPSDM